MKRPPLEDEVLGRLAWDRHLKWWMGEVEFAPGHTIELSASPDRETGEFPIEPARQVYARVRAEDERYRRESARWLLEVYNDFWKERGRDLTTAGYVKRLRLTAVELRADGTARLWYSDGGLFRGHSISVSVGPGGEVERSDIHG